MRFEGNQNLHTFRDQTGQTEGEYRYSLIGLCIAHGIGIGKVRCSQVLGHDTHMCVQQVNIPLWVGVNGVDVMIGKSGSTIAQCCRHNSPPPLTMGGGLVDWHNNVHLCWQPATSCLLILVPPPHCTKCNYRMVPRGTV